MTPRQNTISALVKCAEAYLTHTPMLANSRADSTIHSPCMPAPPVNDP
ncbi:hypothetical protein [Xenophilus azovorans]|nr:hypothetical protein [Xenophilus azovorans]